MDQNPLTLNRCDLFNQAFTHISGCINDVYKDLTKGKAAPLGGVAYLSLEDSEVCVVFQYQYPLVNGSLGALQRRYQVSYYASHEAFPRHGTTLWR